MKAIKNNLRNHPTLVNDLYRISDKLSKGTRYFRSMQGILFEYTEGDKFQAGIIDQQINAGLAELKEAVKRLEALKKDYKAYAKEL